MAGLARVAGGRGLCVVVLDYQAAASQSRSPPPCSRRAEGAQQLHSLLRCIATPCRCPIRSRRELCTSSPPTWKSSLFEGNESLAAAGATSRRSGWLLAMCLDSTLLCHTLCWYPFSARCLSAFCTAERRHSPVCLMRCERSSITALYREQAAQQGRLTRQGYRCSGA